MANGNDVDDGRCEDSGGGGRRVGSRPCQCGIRELWKSLYMPVYTFLTVHMHIFICICVCIDLGIAERCTGSDVWFGTVCFGVRV